VPQIGGYYGEETDAKDLIAAVNSIPAYIECSSHFFTICPTVAHSDLPNVFCDLNRSVLIVWVMIGVGAVVSVGVGMSLVIGMPLVKFYSTKQRYLITHKHNRTALTNGPPTTNHQLAHTRVVQGRVRELAFGGKRREHPCDCGERFGGTGHALRI